MTNHDSATNDPGVPAAGALHPDPEAVDAAMSAYDSARAVIRTQFRALIVNEPGVRADSGPEPLHDARVAVRRLRAALDFFRDAVPAATYRLRAPLAWLGRSLGAVREWDVLSERLGEWIDEHAATELLGEARASLRDKARVRLLRDLDSERCARLVGKLVNFVEREKMPRTAAGREAIVDFAPKRLARLNRRVRKAADGVSADSPAAALHELRIRCKHLRYALEFVDDVYGAPVRRLARRSKDVQDVLGQRQDARVVVAQLLRLAVNRRPRLAGESVDELADVVERCARRGAITPKKLSKLADFWDEDSGKDLRRALASGAKVAREESKPPSPEQQPSIEGTDS
jgi:CHAD domain-containing protein